MNKHHKRNCPMCSKAYPSDWFNLILHGKCIHHRAFTSKEIDAARRKGAELFDFFNN